MPPLLLLAVVLGLARDPAPQEEPRFGGWRILGPFASGGSLAAELPPEKELPQLRAGGPGPELERKHRGFDGGRIAWEDLGGDPQAKIDLAARYGELVEGTVFLHTAVVTTAAVRRPVLLGSDDGLRLWLNGKLVLDVPERRKLIAGEQRLYLDLAAGTNHLLAKVHSVGGAWAFSMQHRPETLAAAEEALKAAVDKAIDRGVENLLARQFLDGSWGNNAIAYPNGHTALALYTLLHCGVPRRHHAVRRATAYLRAVPPAKTYSAACQLMAFGELRDPTLRPEMEAITRELLDWESNGWAYPEGTVDLSCTQFAALGLRAAHAAGVDVPLDAWRDLVECIERFAARDGGYGYHVRGEATGSMTSAAAGVLALARERVGDKLGSREHASIDEGIAAGIAWLEEFYSSHRNPTGPPLGNRGYEHYYLYGIERMAGFLGLDTIANRDWYWEGAQRLLDEQRPEGHWPYEPNTCFALLFLKRATRATLSGVEAASRAETYGEDDPGRDVSLRASGDTPLSLWISSFGDAARARYATSKEAGGDLRVATVRYLLDDAVFAEVPGDLSAPAGKQRWPTSLSLDDIGRHRVRAEVTVISPDGAEVVLRSQTLDVSIDEAPAEELLTYARERGRNELAGKRVEAVASSRKDDAWAAGRAADACLSTGWLAAGDDAQPWIELRLQRPVRAGELRLTPAVGDLTRPHDTALATRIAVQVNKAKEPLVVSFDPRRDRKLVVPLEKPLNVRILRVEVLARTGGDGKPLGWMELELVDPR